MEKILGFCVSILFLWLALGKVEWEKIPPILKTVQPTFVLLMLCSLTIEHLSRGLRWQIILGKTDQPYFYFFAGWVFGGLFNSLFPARAGEFIRSFYLGRKKIVPTSEAFGSVVLERFTDGMVIVFLIIFSFSMFPVNIAIKTAGYSAAFFYLVVLIFILLLQFKKSWFDFILAFLLRPFPESLQQKIKGAQESFIRGFSTIKQPGQVFKVVAISFFTWSFSVLTYWLGLQTFALSLGFKEATLLISILAIGAMIPSSPGMIGIYEYCCVLALTGVIGLPRETSVTVGIFIHFMGFFFIVVVGGILLMVENLSIKDLETEKT